METIFDIGIAHGNDPYALIMELSPDGCNYAFFNTRSKAIDVLKYVVFDELAYESGLEAVLDQFKDRAFEKVAVSVMFREALLVPKEYQFAADALLPILFDRPKSVYVHDTLHEWQLVNMYALPERVYQTVKERFPEAHFVHNFTTSLKNNTAADNHISVHFSRYFLRVILQKDRQLQLAEIYQYKSAMDATYYLLKICSEFGLSQQDSLFYLSGAISAEHELYEELASYFPGIVFAKAPTAHQSAGSDKQPAFISLYNLASCVL